MGVAGAVIREILAFKAASGTIADPSGLLARYVTATERIWEYVDGWHRR